jgi:NAD(P)-dependent dehydrogenase (short-subunit alcohol dehydrogenase family)
MAKTKQTSTDTKVAVGAGLAAAAALAAAGAYWFYGSRDAGKHRAQVKSWMLKARAEVMDAVEKLDDIDKERYMAIVQDVVSRYAGHAGVTAAELAHVTRDLKDTWSHMEATRKSGTRVAKKAKRGTAKAVKKNKKKVSR